MIDISQKLEEFPNLRDFTLAYMKHSQIDSKENMTHVFYDHNGSTYMKTFDAKAREVRCDNPQMLLVVGPSTLKDFELESEVWQERFSCFQYKGNNRKEQLQVIGKTYICTEKSPSEPVLSWIKKYVRNLND